MASVGWGETWERLGADCGQWAVSVSAAGCGAGAWAAVVVAAIKEETDPEMDERAARDPERVRVHWLSLGELSKLIETFQREGVTRAVMAGQVKHKQIFSSIRPDWRLAKLLLNLRTRNTDMLLGAVAKVLGDEGIELISSTAYLEPLLAPAGVLTARAPDETERGGYRVWAEGGAGDCGVRPGADGGDCGGGLRGGGGDGRHGRDDCAGGGVVCGRWSDEASTLERRLTVVKVAKPKQDMRFDVPVVGVPTIEAMRGGGGDLSVRGGGADAAVRSARRWWRRRMRRGLRLSVRGSVIARSRDSLR